MIHMMACVIRRLARHNARPEKQDVNIMNVNGSFVAERHTQSYVLGFLFTRTRKMNEFFGISDATSVNDYHGFGQRPAVPSPNRYKRLKIERAQNLCFSLLFNSIINKVAKNLSALFSNDVSIGLWMLASDREEKRDSPWKMNRK